MKLIPLAALAPAVARFAVLLLFAAPPLLRADEKEDSNNNEPAEAEPGQEPEELSPEELERRYKLLQELEKAQSDKMMKVFQSLEGVWTGHEELKYENDRFPAKTWKDVWEGKYTLGGRYFEMTGQTEGEDMNAAYKWVCSYDTGMQSYRAWYFGENSQNEYTGKLSPDGRHVVWTVRNETNGSESRFSMIADGNRLKCEGTDKLGDGSLFSTQTSEYTRKRVGL